MIRYPVADGAPEVCLGWAPSACHLGHMPYPVGTMNGYARPGEPGAGRREAPAPSDGPRHRTAPGGDMRHEENAPPPADWSTEPHGCGNCAHQWHAVACMDCFCETSCLAPVLVIPTNITLGGWGE